MKTLKILLSAALLICFAASCEEDKGKNPEFSPQELYIYDKKAQTLNCTQNEPVDWEMMVSPNDGSVQFRWILDGVTISTQKDLAGYAFPVAGTFKLIFEASRNGTVNTRTFDLSVATAPL